MHSLAGTNLHEHTVLKTKNFVIFVELLQTVDNVFRRKYLTQFFAKLRQTWFLRFNSRVKSILTIFAFYFVLLKETTTLSFFAEKLNSRKSS
jgi:hypothetical protein